MIDKQAIDRTHVLEKPQVSMTSCFLEHEVAIRLATKAHKDIPSYIEESFQINQKCANGTEKFSTGQIKFHLGSIIE